MAGLIPFNRRNSILSREFGNFYNMIDYFFNSNWPYERSFLHDPLGWTLEKMTRSI